MGAALWDRGNVIVGLYGRWHGDTIRGGRRSFLEGLKIDLGLILSNDAIHYREPIRDYVVVPHGGVQDWDSEAILQANAFYNTDTETYIWYGHWYTSSPWPLPPLPQRVVNKPMGVGLLTMQRDGFGYLSRLLTAPVEGPLGQWEHEHASLLTRLVQMGHPARLILNVDGVTPAAPLTVELVNETGKPIAGFTATVTASSIRQEVRWNGRDRIPAGTPFRVRVIWPPPQAGEPRLYALYLQD